METILWALDLCAVVVACYWALKQDRIESPERPGK